MKKVGILTCYNNKNYGSMLQSYATQIVLGEMGYDCEFLHYKKKLTGAFVIKSLPRLLNAVLMREKLRIIQKKLNMRKHPEIREKNAVRNKAFERFPKKYYHKVSQPYYGYEQLKKCVGNYDAFLVGSDQLWIPSGLPTNFYNLKFVPDNKLKIAYSTSFGVTKIPFYQIGRTKEYLQRFNHIAIREESGKRLIKELTDRNVEVVLDPTLLLDAREWLKVLPDNKIINEPYIFCYFLGSNTEHRVQADILREKTGFKIYTMPHIDEFVPGDETFGDEHLYDVDPSDFVNLIRHAEYVCTDSFHSTIFSILNHKKFIVFDRYSDPLMASRNSRIDNLCSITGLSSRRYKSDIFSQITEDVNYEEVEKRLIQLREKSFKYLKNSLKDIGEKYDNN